MDPSHPDPDPVGSPPSHGLDRPVFPEPPLARLAGWWAARAARSWPGAPPGSGVPDGPGAGEPVARRAQAGAPWPPRWRAPVVTTVVVLAIAGAGWWLVRPAPAPVETVLPVASESSVPGPGGSPPAPDGPDGVPGGSSAPGGGAAEGTGADPTPTPAPAVVVQAAGAVHHPGVHHLPAGSRVDDLVRAAGGATAEADLDRVNLAAPLVDGERVWVPRRGETEVPPVVGGGGGPASGGSAAAAGAPGGVGGATGAGDAPAAPASPVDLNAATAADLDALPGIGPATAAAILAHRDANGPFRSVDDLLDVRGIGEAKLEQLRPLVTV